MSKRGVKVRPWYPYPFTGTFVRIISRSSTKLFFLEGGT